MDYLPPWPRIHELEARVQELEQFKDQLAAVQPMYDKCRDENAEMRRILRDENVVNDQLRHENKRLRVENENYEIGNQQLEAEVDAAKAVIERLELLLREQVIPEQSHPPQT